MADPAGRDPAEGSRKMIDRELARDSAKNPEQEAGNPGGRPTDAVKGSASPHSAGPQGQQGSTTQPESDKDR
jgi:hypothetical protein